MPHLRRHTRRAAIVLASALAAPFAAGSGAAAQPAPPPVVTASSEGTVLAVHVAGQGFTAGRTHSEARSTPSAAATAVAFDNPVRPVAATRAEARTDGHRAGSTEPACAAPVPAGLPLGADLFCSSAAAAVAGRRPASSASAEVTGFRLRLPEGSPAGPPLAAAGGAVLDGLAPVLGAVDDNSGLGIERSLRGLVAAGSGPLDIVAVDVGATEVSTRTTGGALVTSCRTDGMAVTLFDPLPTPAGDQPPALRLVLGPVTTSVRADLASGRTKPAAFPAAVRVTAPAAGFDMPVGPGQAVVVPLPEPLGTVRVSAAGLSTSTDGGRTTAAAPAISVQLPGVELELSACTSAATVAQPPGSPRPAPAPAPAPEATTPDDDLGDLAEVARRLLRSLGGLL